MYVFIKFCENQTLKIEYYYQPGMHQEIKQNSNEREKNAESNINVAHGERANIIRGRKKPVMNFTFIVIHLLFQTRCSIKGSEGKLQR